MCVRVVVQGDEWLAHEVTEGGNHVAEVFLQRILVLDLIAGDDTSVDLQCSIADLYELPVLKKKRQKCILDGICFETHLKTSLKSSTRSMSYLSQSLGSRNEFA